MLDTRQNSFLDQNSFQTGGCRLWGDKKKRCKEILILTERLFMRRCSTSSMESLVRSAMILKGMVLSSAGRLKSGWKVTKLAHDVLFIWYGVRYYCLERSYLKMISIRQRMLIFSNSFFSFSTSAGWAIKDALCTRHSSWYWTKSPWLNAWRMW